MVAFGYEPPCLLACLLLLAQAVSLPGCGDPSPPNRGREEAASPRIVSLSPALSQVLLDLGQGDAIVGCTPWAPAGLESVPVVGDLLEPNLERIMAVRPDLILVQSTREGVDPALRSLAEQRGWAIASWQLNRLKDLDRLLEELPEVLGDVGGDREAARRAAAAWRAQRDRVLVADPVLAGLGTVVVLYAVDPPQVFGKETYLEDVLQELGGRNAINRTGYHELSLEHLAVLAPDAVIVLASGPTIARDQARLLRADLGERAQAMTILWVDGGDLLVPGTRLLDGVDALKASLAEQQR